MKVFILTLGTRGDLELFLGLGLELRRRGHEVVLGTSPFYARRVVDAGIECVPMGDDSQERMLAALRSLAAVRDTAERTRQYFQRWLQPQLAGSVGRITSTGAVSDYFISNLKMALRKDGGVMPGAFVTYDPPAKVGDLERYGSAQHGGRIIEIVAMNRMLIDPEGAWGERYRFTGFWETAGGGGFDLDPALAQFIGGGRPPVVFTMGSMVMFDPERYVRVVGEALRNAGERGIIVTSWAGIDGAAGEIDGVYCVREVPYDWLFPRAGCIVHHGGCGTVAAAVRAGVPSILLPQVLCQVDFAKVLLRQGLAAGAFDIRTVTAAELGRAIGVAVHDERFAAAAADWRERVRTDRGLAAAADLIEAHWHAVGQR
jgi:UDP:flavonoid glycosyltransferase YjiC (YdhE family)